MIKSYPWDSELQEDRLLFIRMATTLSSELAHGKVDNSFVERKHNAFVERNESIMNKSLLKS